MLPTRALLLTPPGAPSHHARPRTTAMLRADSDPSQASERDYAALQRALSRAVARACPAWLTDHRDDIVQIAMTKVVAVIEAGKSEDEIGPAYLARVAYHAVVDEMRRHRRRRTVAVLDDGDDAHDSAASSRPNPEAEAAGRELGAEIRDCLGRMARTRRLAVVLHLEGRGATEIADMFEWKRKQADNLVFRGIADLRRCLRDKGISP